MADRPGTAKAAEANCDATGNPVSASSSSVPAEQKPLPACELIRLPDLIREFAAPLYRYAFRLAGQASDAEDLVQQTFLVAQQKLHQLREAERASAWLYAVLRSCFLKSRRKAIPQTMEDSFPLDHVVDQRLADSLAAGDSTWLDREALQLALAELPDEFKIVVLMFYFEELSYKDIAEQLEIPIGTVMSRLSRGKSHLRRRLAPSEKPEELEARN